MAAIIDGGHSVPGPGPEEVLPGGAVVVAVGSTETVLRMEALLSNPVS